VRKMNEGDLVRFEGRIRMVRREDDEGFVHLAGVWDPSLNKAQEGASVVVKRSEVQPCERRGRLLVEQGATVLHMEKLRVVEEITGDGRYLLRARSREDPKLADAYAAVVVPRDDIRLCNAEGRPLE
jgi:hypothetical protein